MSYVFSLDGCGPHLAEVVGGKAVGLGSLLREELHVPPGFALGPHAYREFVLQTGLDGEVYELLRGAGSIEAHRLASRTGPAGASQSAQGVATQVIGRDEELGSVEAFLAGVEQGPAALVLSGEAGIGKTMLWEAGVEEAERRFGRVLSHRSVEAEALLSFAGISDLLAPVFDEVAPALAPLRRRALEVALLLAEPGKAPSDPRLIGLSLLDVLRALAEEGPVVVALDDVQWLDSSSAAVLQIALRRLRGEPVGLLVTLRKVPGVADRVRARSGLSGRAARAALAPAAEPERAPQSSQGAAWARAVADGALAGAGDLGG